MIVNFNQIVLVLFLLANLAVALYATRRVQTMDEYVKANKELGSGALIATLIATLLDAGNIGIKVAYDKGVISMLLPLFLCIAGLLLGFFVFPKLTCFSNEYTVAELMYTFFGPFARYFTAIASLFFCFFVVIAQLVAWGDVSELLGISPNSMMLMLGFIVTLYTFLGGIRAVARTDLLQFIMILIGVLGFFSVTMYSFGGLKSILNAIPSNAAQVTLPSYKMLRSRILISFFLVFISYTLNLPTYYSACVNGKKKA